MSIKYIDEELRRYFKEIAAILLIQLNATVYAVIHLFLISLRLVSSPATAKSKSVPEGLPVYGYRMVARIAIY